ncbi:MAG: sulfurtransferase [Acidiferrobacter sp.]
MRGYALAGAGMWVHAAWAAHLVALGAMPNLAATGVVVIDTRPVAVCVRQSQAGARCLPPREFLGPHGRLAAWRNIRWLLGTAGLSGSETAVVVGDHWTRENFVAGILYLAGQRRVEVVYRPFTAWIAAHPKAVGAGSAHGMFREPVYVAWPRTRLIVLRHELARIVRLGSRSYLMDGRPLAEYWGRQIVGLRGGHIPGAQSFPMANLRQALAARAVQLPPVRSIIAYDTDPYQSIAYFAFLRVLGLPARVFPGGWLSWSYHTHLPVDDATYPTGDRGAYRTPAVASPGDGGPLGSEMVAVWVAVLITASIVGAVTFTLTRRR